MSEQICDWCQAPMAKHSRIVTSFYAGKGDVWLCTREGCGHEREVPDRRGDAPWLFTEPKGR